MAKGIAVPLDRQRSPAILPIVRQAAEPRLTRLDQRGLNRVSLLLLVHGDVVALESRLRAWTEWLGRHDAEIIVLAHAAGSRTWDAVARSAADDYRVRPLDAGSHSDASPLQIACRAMRGDIALIADAHATPPPIPPEAWHRLLQNGNAEAVVAARPTKLGQRAAIGWLNRLRSLALSAGAGLPIAVRGDIVRHLRLKSRGPEVGDELLCRLAQWGARIQEIPVETQPTCHRSILRGLWRNMACRYWDTQFTTHAGYYILTAVARANRYNRWIVDQVRPFLGTRVFEAGAGIGNLSPLFNACERLVLADHEPFYLERLERRFADDARVRVMPVDLTSADDVARCGEEQIDTVFCSNVLEHLEPDEQVLKSFADLLMPGGHCVLVVPAGAQLYSGIDEELGHFRRYEPESLRRKIEDAGLEVVFSRRFSRLGTLGWAVSGHLLRRRTLSPRQMIWFDRLLPLAKALEHVLPVPGMSLIMVGRKPPRPGSAHRRAA